MRLIDASALFDKQMEMMETLIKSTFNENMSQEALSLLCGAQLTLNAPTVDYVPVVYGRWIPLLSVSGMYECSVCKDEWGAAAKMVPMKYCPHCGAKMDLEG